HASLLCFSSPLRRVFFLSDTTSTDIYTLSLHDALPILRRAIRLRRERACPSRVQARTRTRRRRETFRPRASPGPGTSPGAEAARSEEHTSELQSRENLVCRLLLEKKNKNANSNTGQTDN